MCCVEKSAEFRSGTKVRSLETVRNQIGFCGLWCGSCAVGNGLINKHAGELERLVRDYAVEDWGPKEIDYAGFRGGLALIRNLPPCPGCLKGGGRADCEIRACATGRRLTECAECEDIDNCGNSEILNHMRSGALKAGMVVKREKGNRSEFLKRK